MYLTGLTGLYKGLLDLLAFTHGRLYGRDTVMWPALFIPEYSVFIRSFLTRAIPRLNPSQAILGFLGIPGSQ